jgi:hypothetical protein
VCSGKTESCSHTGHGVLHAVGFGSALQHDFPGQQAQVDNVMRGSIAVVTGAVQLCSILPWSVIYPIVAAIPQKINLYCSYLLK